MRNRDGRYSVVQGINARIAPPELACGFTSRTNTEQISSTLNVADVMYVIYQCCDPMLRQALWTKLEICKLAFPIILPSPRSVKSEVCLWALRPLLVHCSMKQCDVSLPTASIPSVAFMRLGDVRLSISKSLIINHMIGMKDTVFNRDSPTGDTPADLCTGMLECSIYHASSKPDDVFPQSMLLLNLRGNANTPSGVITMCKHLSDIVVVFLEPSVLLDPETIDNVRNLFIPHKGILIIDNSKTELIEKDIDEFTRLVGTTAFANMYTIEVQPKRETRKNEQTLSQRVKDMIINIQSKWNSGHASLSLENRLSGLPKTLRKLLHIDEDISQCTEQQKHAVRLWKQIGSISSTKDSMASSLPMQGDQWKEYSLQIKASRASKGITLLCDIDAL